MLGSWPRKEGEAPVLMEPSHPSGRRPGFSGDGRQSSEQVLWPKFRTWLFVLIPRGLGSCCNILNEGASTQVCIRKLAPEAEETQQQQEKC